MYMVVFIVEPLCIGSMALFSELLSQQLFCIAYQHERHFTIFCPLMPSIRTLFKKAWPP